MTVTGPANDDSRRHRTAMWLGHYATQISLAANTALAVSWTINHAVDTPGPVEWALVGPSAAAIIVSVAATICEQHVHDRNLCLRDLDRSPLLDPDREVTRRIRTLRATHRYGTMVTLASAGLVLMLAAIFAGEWMRDHHIPGSAAVAIGGFGASTAFSMWHVWATAVHRRLQPWCPLCYWGRDDDGDDDDPEPDDPTDPSVEVKQRQTSLHR